MGRKRERTRGCLSLSEVVGWAEEGRRGVSFDLSCECPPNSHHRTLLQLLEHSRPSLLFSFTTKGLPLFDTATAIMSSAVLGRAQADRSRFVPFSSSPCYPTPLISPRPSIRLVWEYREASQRSEKIGTGIPIALRRRRASRRPSQRWGQSLLFAFSHAFMFRGLDSFVARVGWRTTLVSRSDCSKERLRVWKGSSLFFLFLASFISFRFRRKTRDMVKTGLPVHALPDLVFLLLFPFCPFLDLGIRHVRLPAHWLFPSPFLSFCSVFHYTYIMHIVPTTLSFPS